MLFLVILPFTIITLVQAIGPGFSVVEQRDEAHRGFL